MQVDVTRAIQSPGETFAFDLLEGHAPEEWDGDVMTFEGPIHVSGTYMMLEDVVQIKAKVKASVCVPCANCLEEARYTLTAQMDENFVRDAQKAQEDDFTYEGHTLELEDAVMGTIFMNMPMRILCRPDCKGLCPHCYQNLNHAACSCPKELPVKQPFAALASLLNQDEEV